MAPPIVKRYLIAFEKYKWVGLSSFALVVAGSTIVATQPEPSPTYVADAALTYIRPPVSFSTTGSEIQQQGQELKSFLVSRRAVVLKSLSDDDDHDAAIHGPAAAAILKPLTNMSAALVCPCARNESTLAAKR
jgi:hypothetical protein